MPKKDRREYHKKRSKIYYKEHHDELLLKKKIYYEKNKDKITDRVKKYRKNNLEKCRQYNKNAYKEEFAARNYIAYEIKKGNIVRPDKCSKCNKICKPDGHHFDYSKIYEVTWLCRKCHKEAHGYGIAQQCLKDLEGK